MLPWGRKKSCWRAERRHSRVGHVGCRLDKQASRWGCSKRELHLGSYAACAVLQVPCCDARACSGYVVDAWGGKTAEIAAEWARGGSLMRPSECAKAAGDSLTHRLREAGWRQIVHRAPGAEGSFREYTQLAARQQRCVLDAA